MLLEPKDSIVALRGQLGLFAAPCINNACKRDCETSNFANIRLQLYQLPDWDGSIMALSGCPLFTPELLIAVKCPHLTGTVSAGGPTAGRGH